MTRNSPIVVQTVDAKNIACMSVHFSAFEGNCSAVSLLSALLNCRFPSTASCAACS